MPQIKKYEVERKVVTVLTLLIIAIFAGIILVFGIYEKNRHQRRIDAIPIRININGVRGKSTVTRLTTGIFFEAGYQTVGKTTGTMARMIYGDHEDPITRKREGPNIREQMEVVRKSVSEEAEALISECMAVSPDYQIIFQKQFMQANIGVIVNVLEDHMNVLGPTLKEVAESFTATIPYNGYLIVNNSEFVTYFEQIARDRNTKVIVCDTTRISENFLKRFEYMVFPENAALALAIADVLGIDENVACQGMLNANPDPGALRIMPIGRQSPSYLVNGFAANDTTSTINIWERIKQLGYPTEKPVIIMNCRDDRVDRTEQFAEEVLPELDIDTLVAIGKGTNPITYAYEDGTIPSNNYLNLEGYDTDEIINELMPFFQNRTIYGVGNIHGSAEPLIEKLDDIKDEIQINVSEQLG